MPSEPLNFRFGGGVEASLLHPVVLIAMLISSILVLILPRRWAPVSVFFFAFLMPPTQQIYIAGIHLFALRIVVLIGLVRCLLRRKRDEPFLAGGMIRLDRTFLLCLLAQSICVVLLFRDVHALIFELGFLWDFGGGYFLLRSLIRDREDVHAAAKSIALVMVPLGLEMLYEQTHMSNLFGTLGGLPLVPEIREGAVRAQGDFSHPLLAGTFGGVMFSVVLMLFPRHKIVATLGGAGSILMVLATHSSTPLLGLAGSIIPILVWPLRDRMKRVRQLVFVGLVLLQLVMKAPVYFLIARVDLTGSSSSYHRALLVDAFIRNVSSWWLIGTADNVNWGLDTFDVQNQFVEIGIRGGMVALLAIIATLVIGFSLAGRARATAAGTGEEWESWILGGMLFANMVAFFGVNYFDQSRYILLVPLAMIAAYGIDAATAKTPTGNESERRSHLPISVQKWAGSFAKF